MAKPNESALTNNFEFEALRHASNYRKSLVREFAQFLSGEVIEVGAGIGQLTSLVAALPNVRSVQAVEPDPDFCRKFREQLPDSQLIEGTVTDLPANARANVVLSVNVLEHIQNDLDELKRYHALLKLRGGSLCLFVPARQELYAQIDRDFGHFRRYAKRELALKLQQAGFQIRRLNYFNSLGYFAWLANFKILGKRHFAPGAVRFFDRVLFPPVNFLESRICRPPFGQSLIAIAHVHKG